MTEVATGRDLPLKWEVLVTPGIPAVTSDLAPGTKQRPWPPISSTLISGERDAVLVDAIWRRGNPKHLPMSQLL
jgi:hypothetical protein